MSFEFHVEASAKVILAGEYSVVRGGRALAMPFLGPKFTLHFERKENQALDVAFPTHLSQESILVFYGALERALILAGHTRADLRGRLSVASDIPIASGLGSSAALCVAIGKWMVHLGWIQENQLFSYCRELEHVFHGESSGVDIAAILAEKPIQFQKDQAPVPMDIRWAPPFMLSFTGIRGATAECVARVNRLRERDPQLGDRLDVRMQECVARFESALRDRESHAGMLKLIEAMNLGYSCFEEWGLNEVSVHEHMDELRAHGALTVKPTGSGAGGYVLSLWSDVPPSGLRSSLKPLNLTQFIRA